MSKDSTPSKLKSNYKRSLSLPIDLFDPKKSKSAMSQATSEHALPEESVEPLQGNTTSPSLSSTIGSVPPVVYEAVGNLPPIANITLTDDHIAVIANIVTQSLKSQTSSMVSSIVDGVLSGWNQKISGLEEENIRLKDRVAVLEAKADKAEQYSRRNCLRLTGIPETKDESVDDKVMKVATAIDADFTIGGIDRTHRLGKPMSEVNKTKPRDIIIKFISYRSRQKLLRNKRKVRESGYARIFLNEDLTYISDKIFYSTRKLAKGKVILNTLTKDGVILVKNVDSRIHRVETFADLEKFSHLPLYSWSSLKVFADDN